MRKTANSEKYHFADFTYSHFRKMLKLAGQTHVARTYLDYRKDENFIIWRHDADFSMQSALSLARIEAEEGITSTYFVLLHSEFYNLLDRDNTRCVKEILRLGHNVELHFDPDFHGITETNDFEKHLMMEKNILERVTDHEVKVFSIHNPADSKVDSAQDRYAGLVNATSAYLKNEVAYCSDSNGIWRHKRMEDFLLGSTVVPVIILTHPEWWTEKVMSPSEKIKQCIDGRADYTRDFIEEFLKRHGREPVEW